MAQHALTNYLRQRKLLRTSRRGPFVAAALPLALGAAMMATNRAAGIAWALLVCAGGLLSVALTQPRVPADRGRRGHRETP